MEIRTETKPEPRSAFYVRFTPEGKRAVEMAAATLEQSPVNFLRGAALEKAKRDAGITLAADLEAALELEESPPQEDSPRRLHDAPPMFLMTPISPEQMELIRRQRATDQAKKNHPVLTRADSAKGMTLEEAQRIEAEWLYQEPGKHLADPPAAMTVPDDDEPY